MNEIIKQNNQNVVTDALSNKEVLDSVVLEKINAQKMFEKEEALKTIQPKLETILVGVDFNDIKTNPESVLIEDRVKKNPKISDADIDFEIVGQYPPLYYSDEVGVKGRLKPFNLGVEFDDAETIKYARYNDDSETIMYTNDL